MAAEHPRVFVASTAYNFLNVFRSIRVDGKEVLGKTPTTLTLPAGKHKIEFLKDGFASKQHEVEVFDGALRQFSISWSEKK